MEKRSDGEIIGGNIPNNINDLKALTLDILESIVKFPSKNPAKDNTRENIMGKRKKPIYAFVMGKVRSYSESELVEASKNRRFPFLLSVLKKLIKVKDSNFKWNSIQVNRNVPTEWHRDKGNRGMSYCLALGNFSGGGIDIKDDESGKIQNLNNKNKFVFYDGNLEHRTAKKYGGDRYAIIWFYHT